MRRGRRLSERLIIREGEEIQLQKSNVRQLAITREQAWHWALENAKQRQAYCYIGSYTAEFGGSCFGHPC